jgi:hypothetical protein
LEFPAGEREFDEWTTYGAAVVNKKHAVVVPEIAGARGGIGANFNLKPRLQDRWVVDVKLDIGNDGNTNRGGNGVGIFYL